MRKLFNKETIPGRKLYGEIRYQIFTPDILTEFYHIVHWFFRDTFAIFQCGQPNRGPDSFTTNYINSANAVFTLHTDEILTIKVVRPPPDATTYTDYLRAHDVTIHRQPIEVSIALFF